jgi:arylsulfatase A-like enzyme
LLTNTPRAFQPLRNGIEYHRFYYEQQKEVDKHIGTVVDALANDRRNYGDTVVIYLSDHGEMLGSHGGMFQKWHSAYDEILKVPFIFHNPTLFNGAQASDILTSHADVLPIMLGLAGLNEAVLAKELTDTHTKVRRLVGRDLSSVLLGEESAATFNSDPVYFMTDDQPVEQPNCVESVVTYLPTGPAGSKERWKYNRYWDNSQTWTTPGLQDVQTFVPGPVNKSGNRVAVTTVKAVNPTTGQIAPPADQFELYNLTVDPTEMTNLYTDSAASGTLKIMQVILQEQRTAKRLSPVDQPWADGSMRQFPFTPN